MEKITEKTYPNRFFGEHVTIQNSFVDEEKIECAYYIGETIAVFRQTDLDSGRHITLVKFDKDDFGRAARKVYFQFIKNVRHDFVAAN